jgi:hypothetical protein
MSFKMAAPFPHPTSRLMTADDGFFIRLPVISGGPGTPGAVVTTTTLDQGLDYKVPNKDMITG